MNKQVSWQVELAVKPGELENFRALTSEMVAFTQTERGVLIYERFISTDSKTVYVYERYADADAAVVHLLAFRQKFGVRFSSMVDRQQFLVFGTPSDALREILDGFGATYFHPFGGFSTIESFGTFAG